MELRNLEHAKTTFESDLEAIGQSQEQIAERTRHTTGLLNEITKKLGSIQTILDTPENLSFDELREDVAALELQFGQFYESLEIAASVDAVRQHADRFRTSFHIFKQRALELAQNPFTNFEKQKKALGDILAQKGQRSLRKLIGLIWKNQRQLFNMNTKPKNWQKLRSGCCKCA